MLKLLEIERLREGLREALKLGDRLKDNEADNDGLILEEGDKLRDNDSLKDGERDALNDIETDSVVEGLDDNERLGCQCHKITGDIVVEYEEW